MWCEIHVNSTNYILTYTQNVMCIEIPVFVLQHAPGAERMLNALYSMEIS